MRRFLALLLTTAPLLGLAACVGIQQHAALPQNSYRETRFVANKAAYNAAVTEPRFVNAWGLAIRPAGAGGHFWVTAKDISYEYVGDVAASPNPTLRTLHQDGLKEVRLPVGGPENVATGTVFNGSAKNFVIHQRFKGVPPITAPAKFLFASDGGIVSAWTERKKAEGTFDWPAQAIPVIDQSKDGAQFFGLTLSHDYSRLYVADFGANPALKVFDGHFKPSNIAFESPFDTNKNGRVDAGEYAPFNVQSLRTPSGKAHVFVAYAKTQSCPAVEVRAKTCAKGALFVGEEDTRKPGYGRVVEFTEDGRQIAVWKDGGKLSAPWGMAFAPSNFGALSGHLLVANFGDGRIAAYNPTTRAFADFLRDTQGKPLVVDKVWALLFGNGEHLGDRNALYYAAGPNDEADGLWGSLRPVE